MGLRRYERILVEIVLFERWVHASLSAQISGGRGRAPTTFGVRKLESLGYLGVVCVILRLALLMQSWRVTDRQTHRQTHTR